MCVVFEDCPVYPQFWEFLRICRTCEKSSRELAERAVLLFHEILLKLSDNLLSARLAHGEREKSAVSETALQVKEYIDAHIYEKIVVSDLARIASLSASQLTRVFRIHTDRARMTMCWQERLTTACRLLLNTGMSVKEVHTG